MKTLDALDHIAINDVLCRFFLAFDERDWASMQSCLSTEVFIDYASSGREQPSTMSSTEFVQRRRNAVDTLAKHHSFSNLLLSSEPEGVRGRCNYLILRFDRDFKGEGEDFYHSCGAYEFRFGKAEGAWKITSITQRALQSWGNRQLHGGSRKPEAQDKV
ncbi:nuclear transport factor 2 family protein [Microvirga sp. VF16]|uniref:nuclear transport factor 2 family protein n=1 Tax=Microvirga sp. VF16 TaxID=2807101 RepID=UPI00193E31DF|nr:nuclear transport factor 2 family protein [Microvirga sp. VF16]QRM35704.1 nuclear transport factor 2 family protein [Microvirga sp. VF16]